MRARTKLGRLGVMVLIAAQALVACTSAYQPRRTSHVAMVMEAGRFQLDRNGQRYDLGLFGGDLEEAVAPHAAAMDHAATYRHQLLGGFALSVAAAVPLGVGLGMTLDQNARGTESWTGPSQLVGAVVAYVVGLSLVTGAQTHLYDAINEYNDWVNVGMPADATVGTDPR